jgi:hypothetical protein
MKKLPDKEALIKKLRFLIEVHPLKPVRSKSLTFIYLGLHDEYPDIVSFSDLNAISRRKKTPEQIAEAILLIRQQHTAVIWSKA